MLHLSFQGFLVVNRTKSGLKLDLHMGKRLLLLMWSVSIVVGLAIAIPTSYNFAVHQKAKTLALQGCESWWLDVRMIPAQSLFSQAARLDPAFIPLSTASKVLIVDRPTARAAGYEQQWLDNLQVLQGFCEMTINPDPGKE
jgi:hypothetical protein